MNGAREWNILLDEIRDVALQSHGFTAGLERMQQQCRSRTTLASAHVPYLDLLLYIWLFILE